MSFGGHVPAADLVFLGAELLTPSPSPPGTKSVAIRDGVIVAVGSEGEIRCHLGPRTRVVEGAGRCLVPGFHDAHLHLHACASQRLSVDCAPRAVSSIAEIQRAIGRRAATLPAGEWIRAGAYDDFALAEKRHPTRWDLDAVAPRHPVRLVHRSYHACVLNTLALRSLHLDGRATPPAARMEVDPQTGEPTGLIYEFEEYAGKGKIPPISEDELRSALREVATDLLSKGVTSVQDATATNGPAEWRLLQEMSSGGALGPRITLMIGREHLPEMVELGLASPGEDPWLRPGPVKLMLTETGEGFQPEAEELFDHVWAAHRLGFPVAIHAVEESAVCLATEAIAAALLRLPRPDHRHRLEHASLAPPALLDRVAELGIGIATQPGFLYSMGDRYLAQVEEQQRPWLYALRAMLERGIVVAAGSDAPVAPADPLLGLFAAATRRTRQGRTVTAEQTIDGEQALRMFTSAPAWLVGQEHRLGSIAPGMAADMALITANPLALGAEEIKGLAVAMTVVNGRIAWESGGGRQD